MNQVQNVKNIEENNLQTSEPNRFAACEQVVSALVEQGLPKAFAPATYINRIAKVYGINLQEARICLKLAIGQLEVNSNKKDTKADEKLYAQSGYFYPSGNVQKEYDGVKDNMDSLSSLGKYNKLMFGI